MKEKKKTFRWVILWLIISLMAYLVSKNNQIQAITLSGNHYLSDEQIYEQAGLHVGGWSIWPNAYWQAKLSSHPLIQSAKVTKSQYGLRVSVKEVVFVGAVHQKKHWVAYQADGTKMVLKNESLLHFIPNITSLSKEKQKKWLALFKDHPQMANLSFLSRISQVDPFTSQFSSDMVKLTMRDGNAVYSEFSSLSMLKKYQAVLTKLNGVGVCLFLDQENRAIDKIDCADMTKKKENKKEKESTQTEQSTTQSPTTESEPAQTETSVDYDSQASDWVYNEFFGMNYSESLDLYSDGQGHYWRYDDQLGQLTPVQ